MVYDVVEFVVVFVIFSQNNMNFHYGTLICSWTKLAKPNYGPTTNQGFIMKIHIVPRKDAFLTPSCESLIIEIDRSL